MPFIALTQPFIKHYQGSIFNLNLPQIAFEENETYDITRPTITNIGYLLPDDGKGKECWLPKWCTKEINVDLNPDLSLCCGPCRITSVSDTLRGEIDYFWTDPLPMGMGKLEYLSTSLKSKYGVKYDAFQEEDLNSIKVVDMLHRVLVYQHRQTSKIMDFSDLNAGFYRVSLLRGEEERHYFTLIKCFPLYAIFEAGDNLSGFGKVIW